ncbi:MAG: type II toxin-antitoxin system prevent-host-death family antitoxin [Coxiella sp. (in: Bacteria)]|nr:MAG: type II toxin-antitoxin system prevent-host-death family antitoxin [Coxiella sp. (in: g-proteobacteria)]
MKTYTVTQARQNIYKLVEAVEESHQPIQITGKNANAVLVSETDWRAIQETLYLLSIPNMRESIRDGLDADPNDCEEDLGW